jgi:hypothetical protein
MFSSILKQVGVVLFLAGTPIIAIIALLAVVLFAAFFSSLALPK